MNITISLEKELVERAREVAKSQGLSLQGLLRRYLESLAGPAPEAAVDELLELMQRHGGHSGGQPFRREDAYQGRL